MGHTGFIRKKKQNTAPEKAQGRRKTLKIFVLQNYSSRFCCLPEGKLPPLAFHAAVSTLKSSLTALGDSREQPNSYTFYTKPF